MRNLYARLEVRSQTERYLLIDEKMGQLDASDRPSYTETGTFK